MQDGANGTTTVYDSGFFAGQRDGSLVSARIVVPLMLELFPVRSVVDVGCGVGTWLSVFAESGVADLAGYDGDYVDRAMLAIPPAQFHAADLSAPVAVGRRFDLAVCLEVAEHLSEATGPTLIETLTTAAGTETRTLQAMLYAAPTGAAPPAPATEYVLVAAVEAAGQAWVDICAGSDVGRPPVTITVSSCAGISPARACAAKHASAASARR